VACHVVSFSRKPVMDDETFSSLVAKAEAMGLNPKELQAKRTPQDG
jgi:hypothetical protein